MPKQPSTKVVDDALAALDAVRREWMRRPGVNAVDVGFKIKDGELSETVAIRVHVARKKPMAELADTEVFNVSGRTPRKQGGFPVDVIEATYGPSQYSADAVVLEDIEDIEDIEAVNRRDRVSPLIAGISVGNPRVTAGTLGAVVYDRRTCQASILSNWHVLAGDTVAAAGEPILQPGRADGGIAPRDTVATLNRFRLDADMDAAIATLTGARPYDREVLGLGAISGMVTPALGMNVSKSGRTTGLTEGVISGVGMSVSIDYGGGAGVVTLNGQINIVPRPPWPSVDYEVSRGGDSGSVWMQDGTRRAVGLHFGGETNPAPASEHGIATPIQRVATGLEFSFLPVICRRPIVDFCDRYPRICEIVRLLRIPFPIPIPPVPSPPTGIRPSGEPVPSSMPYGYAPGAAPYPVATTSTQVPGGCTCGRGGHDPGLAEELLALVTELSQR